MTDTTERKEYIITFYIQVGNILKDFTFDVYYNDQELLKITPALNSLYEDIINERTASLKLVTISPKENVITIAMNNIIGIVTTIPTVIGQIESMLE